MYSFAMCAKFFLTGSSSLAVHGPELSHSRNPTTNVQLVTYIYTTSNKKVTHFNF